MKNQTEKTAKQKEEEFIPFGEEWQKEMMKMDKKELVQVIKKIAIENVNYQFEIHNIGRRNNEGFFASLKSVFKPNPEIMVHRSNLTDEPRGMIIGGRGKITKSSNH